MVGCWLALPLNRGIRKAFKDEIELGSPWDGNFGWLEENLPLVLTNLVLVYSAIDVPGAPKSSRSL